jgi:hypothetical protein
LPADIAPHGRVSQYWTQYGTAEQLAEKVVSRAAAPKGIIDSAALAASLKRCPDTNRAFFRKL